MFSVKALDYAVGYTDYDDYFSSTDTVTFGSITAGDQVMLADRVITEYGVIYGWEFALTTAGAVSFHVSP